jgi:hypothetical protein
MSKALPEGAMQLAQSLDRMSFPAHPETPGIPITTIGLDQCRYIIDDHVFPLSPSTLARARDRASLSTACGTTITLSASPTTRSPVRTRTPAHSIGLSMSATVPRPFESSGSMPP